MYGPTLPADAGEKIYVWVRDGWSTDENSVIADARQAGTTSPTLFVLLPSLAADHLRQNIIQYKAAFLTLERRGVPGSEEGQEARSAIDTKKSTAERKINELLDNVIIQLAHDR